MSAAAAPPSLSRALQLISGVGRTWWSGLHMSDLTELPIAILLIAAYSSPMFAVLGLPGLLACLALRSALVRHPRRCRFALSTTAAALGAPYLVAGHSPLMLPLPFGVALAHHMGVSSVVIT